MSVKFELIETISHEIITWDGEVHEDFATSRSIVTTWTYLDEVQVNRLVRLYCEPIRRLDRLQTWIDGKAIALNPWTTPEKIWMGYKLYRVPSAEGQKWQERNYFIGRIEDK